MGPWGSTRIIEMFSVMIEYLSADFYLPPVFIWQLLISLLFISLLFFGQIQLPGF